jgi:hypothetical protein
LTVEQIDHYRIFFDRLDEQQKRWFAALEADRRGRGGLEAVCRLFDLSANTVRRGRDEIASGLSDRPTDRYRTTERICRHAVRVLALQDDADPDFASPDGLADDRQVLTLARATLAADT